MGGLSNSQVNHEQRITRQPNLVESRKRSFDDLDTPNAARNRFFGNHHQKAKFVDWEGIVAMYELIRRFKMEGNSKSSIGMRVFNEDRHLIKRSEAAHNGVYAYLCISVKTNLRPPLERVLKDSQRRRKLFDAKADYVKKIAAFRNELIHGKVESFQYFAAMTLRTV